MYLHLHLCILWQLHPTATAIVLIIMSVTLSTHKSRQLQSTNKHKNNQHRETYIHKIETINLTFFPNDTKNTEKTEN